MNVDPLLFLIVYVFSVIAIAIGLYAVWTVSELRDEIKRIKSAKRINPPQPKKPSSSWPPSY